MESKKIGFFPILIVILIVVTVSIGVFSIIANDSEDPTNPSTSKYDGEYNYKGKTVNHYTTEFDYTIYPSNGKTFYEVTGVILNLRSNNGLSNNSLYFTLNVDGVEYDSKYRQGDIITATPGATITFDIYFEIPSNFNSAKLTYSPWLSTVAYNPNLTI
jgi:hypothetical protein